MTAGIVPESQCGTIPARSAAHLSTQERAPGAPAADDPGGPAFRHSSGAASGIATQYVGTVDVATGDFNVGGRLDIGIATVSMEFSPEGLAYYPGIFVLSSDSQFNLTLQSTFVTSEVGYLMSRNSLMQREALPVELSGPEVPANICGPRWSRGCSNIIPIRLRDSTLIAANWPWCSTCPSPQGAGCGRWAGDLE